MSFEYTEAEKKQMLVKIENLKAVINGLEEQKSRAKTQSEKDRYSIEISRLKNEIDGLRAYMR